MLESPSGPDPSSHPPSSCCSVPGNTETSCCCFSAVCPVAPGGDGALTGSRGDSQVTGVWCPFAVHAWVIQNHLFVHCPVGQSGVQRINSMLASCELSSSFASQSILRHSVANRIATRAHRVFACFSLHDF